MKKIIPIILLLFAIAAWGQQTTGGGPAGGSGTGITSLTATTPIVATPSPITATGVFSCPTCAIGPGASTAGHIATFLGTDGLTLADGGAVPAGTVTHTGGALTSNAVVLGAGGNDTKVSTGITTNGVAELDVGVSGTSGVFGLNGSTSGKATLTAPAIAGTAGNAVLFSNAISWATGLGPINNIQGATDQSLTLFASNGRSITLEVSGANDELVLDNASGNRFYPQTNNQIALGLPGGFSWKSFSTILYQTDTNCAAVGTAANPSVASCSAAAAGSFSCATNASTGTCTVNTTAVTANSEILIEGRNDTTTGTRLGVTCNTGITTALPEISAVVAATSFTINLGTFTTNPECFSYFIVN